VRIEEFGLQEQSNSIQWLLDAASEQGYLTHDQILETFSEAKDDVALLMDQLDDLFATLHDQGLAVYDSEGEAEETLGGNGNHRDALLLNDISVNNPIGLYFNEVMRVPLLSYEEEITLAKQFEQGRKAQQQLTQGGHVPQDRARLEQLVREGQESRQQLIKANTRLVVSIAKRYRGLGLPFLDLIQAGNLGLIKATDRFDYRRGNRFATYATWWIRQSVTRSITQLGRTVRVPVHLSDRIRRLHKTAQRLEQDLGRPPTPEEIAEEANLKPDRVRWMMQIWWHPISLDKPVGEEGDREFGSLIENKNAPSPAQSAEQHLLREDLEKTLIALRPREARVLRLRFGLQGELSHSLEEIGNKIGVTRERARQIVRTAIRKLRHPRNRRKLQGYLG
jgi:RNA polymerase primary sigma factor